MTEDFTVASSTTSILVGVLALVLAALALRAARRRANPGLRWVGAAFVVFAVKDAFSAYNVVTHVVPHDAIELVLSVFDLALLAMLFVPLLLVRRKAA
jgi:hypothetical protein